MMYGDILGKRVTIVVDRPMGSVHPSHADMVYPVNYGYVQDILGGDGEEQDVYLLGVDQPVERSDGVVIAVIRRLNDVEDKWVAAPEGMSFTDEEIMHQTHFQERYFQIQIYCAGY